jgi:hypothetical protein
LLFLFVFKEDNQEKTETLSVTLQAPGTAAAVCSLQLSKP